MKIPAVRESATSLFFLKRPPHAHLESLQITFIILDYIIDLGILEILLKLFCIADTVSSSIRNMDILWMSRPTTLHCIICLPLFIQIGGKTTTLSFIFAFFTSLLICLYYLNYSLRKYAPNKLKSTKVLYTSRSGSRFRYSEVVERCWILGLFIYKSMRHLSQQLIFAIENEFPAISIFKYSKITSIGQF